MRLIFDFEITGFWIPDTPKARLIITEIRNFIQQRVNVLESEIQKYPDGFMVFNLMRSGFFANSPHVIRVIHFPEDLERKITECFTNQDLSYLNEKVSNAAESL